MSAQILTECCEQNTPCEFLIVQSDYSVRARFESMHPEGVNVRISADGRTDALVAQAICSISFTHQASFCEFLGDVVSVRQLESNDQLVLVAFPRHLTMTRLRQSFRVPVMVNSGLDTSVTSPEKNVYKVTTNDISVAGIEIEFTNERPALSVGLILSVELRFRGMVIIRESEVRRIEGALCGLWFPDQGNSDDLRQLVLSLQQLWLKSRLK